MSARPTTLCDECSSLFYVERSAMTSMCAECAHVLYGYPACEHVFVAKVSGGPRCEMCGWDGSRSAFVLTLVASRE